MGSAKSYEYNDNYFTLFGDYSPSNYPQKNINISATRAHYVGYYGAYGKSEYSSFLHYNTRSNSSFYSYFKKEYYASFSSFFYSDVCGDYYYSSEIYHCI